MRHYRTFSWRDATLKIASDRFAVVVDSIRRERALLEAYLPCCPDFRSSMIPIPPAAAAPEAALRMHRAAYRVGVGPMAAVAGTMAQLAAEAARQAGANEAIVENGGDMYLISDQPVTVALHAGSARLGSRLAFCIGADELPLAVCSSSSTMGHSLSLGACDLATVLSVDGSLADAAATHACNLVRERGDLESACASLAGIAGIRGVLMVKDDSVAMAGALPDLVRNTDSHTKEKITRHGGLATPI